MLSSTKHKINLSAFSISTSSPSSSSSTSSSLGQSSAQVTMEEIWKEINLGSLHHHHQLNISHEPMLKNQNPDNSIFQYFLNMPLNQQPPPPPSSSSIVTALYSSSLPLRPPLANVFSLHSGVGFEFFDKTDSLVAAKPQSNEEPARSGSLGKKRSHDSDESKGDRRHKRMIKNRESAARSRARKQAYTNELELEIAHLQRENARLKRQQEQLKLEEATKNHVKKTLQRSSTAPF